MRGISDVCLLVPVVARVRTRINKIAEIDPLNKSPYSSVKSTSPPQ